MSRYIVTYVEGYLTDRTGGGTAQLPGRSYVVLDTLVNHRCVGQFRSESYQVRPGDYGSQPRAVQIRRAQEAAEALAARLNNPPPPRRTQSDYSFRPTCPRCSTICPAGARYCNECGTYLYLTNVELAEMRGEVV